MNTFLFEILNGLVERSPLLDGFILFLAQYLPYLLTAAFGLYVLQEIKEGRAQLVALALGIGAPFLARLAAAFIHSFELSARPYITEDIPHLLNVATASFPSGHAATFFALAAIMYAHDQRLGIAFFVLATLMGIARVAAGVHYPVDIVGGAAIGMLIGWMALRFRPLLRRI